MTHHYSVLDPFEEIEKRAIKDATNEDMHSWKRNLDDFPHAISFMGALRHQKELTVQVAALPGMMYVVGGKMWTLTKLPPTDINNWEKFE